MKSLMFSLFVIALLMAAPAAAQKVYVDYDQSVDFTSFKTFAWGPTPETSVKGESPLMHSRIKNSIEFHLTEGGLVEDTENPDLYVTYHGSSREETRLTTTGMGYGYGGGWGWNAHYPNFNTTTTSHTYDRGTLIIDLWDANTKEAIWRGTAEAVVKTNPQQAAKQLEKAINKIVKRWQKQHAKDMKNQ